MCLAILSKTKCSTASLTVIKTNSNRIIKIVCSNVNPCRQKKNFLRKKSQTKTSASGLMAVAAVDTLTCCDIETLCQFLLAVQFHLYTGA